MTHCTHLLQRKCTVLASNSQGVHTGRLTHLLVQTVQKCGDGKVDGCLARWWHTQQIHLLASLTASGFLLCSEKCTPALLRLTWGFQHLCEAGMHCHLEPKCMPSAVTPALLGTLDSVRA